MAKFFFIEWPLFLLKCLAEFIIGIFTAPINIFVESSKKIPVAQEVLFLPLIVVIGEVTNLFILVVRIIQIVIAYGKFISELIATIYEQATTKKPQEIFSFREATPEHIVYLHDTIGIANERVQFN